jgi:hypothetical protein
MMKFVIIKISFLLKPIGEYKKRKSCKMIGQGAFLNLMNMGDFADRKLQRSVERDIVTSSRISLKQVGFRPAP